MRCYARVPTDIAPDVNAIYFGGTAISRLVFVPVTRRFGERRVVSTTITAACGFLLLSWRLPGVIAPSAFVALLGLALGPLFPNALSLMTASCVLEPLAVADRPGYLGAIISRASDGSRRMSAAVGTAADHAASARRARRFVRFSRPCWRTATQLSCFSRPCSSCSEP